MEATKTTPRARKASQRRVEVHIPCATYRLQFGKDFSFRDAEAIAPYLHDLGISDAYASPILKSRPGSHGYDITDHTQLNPELGGQEDFDRLASRLREHDLGLILDTVPNHMGIDDPANTWWMDVLENGPSSPYSQYFDVQWQPVKRELENRVLLPILGDQYGNVLENGQFRLAYEEGTLTLYYFDHKLPVAPRTYTHVLTPSLAQLTERLPAEDEALLEFQSILTALGYLPPRTETDPEKLAERARESLVIKRRLHTLYESRPEVREALDATIEAFNGKAGDPRSFDNLDALIEAQVVRPSFWRVAGEEINYRRFFDVNDLAAIRVELQEVFDASHALFMRLLAEGKASGLRIDHPDGLWGPPRYFQRLQAAYVKALASARDKDASANGNVEPGADVVAQRPLYVVAEKILSHTEPLPQDWAVYGTTGYDFLNQVNGLFVNSTNEKAFDRLYARFTEGTTDYARLVHQNKLLIMRSSLVSEINMLSHELERIGETNRHYRDFTLNGLTRALREVIASLPVYRTYINAVTGEVPERDREVVEATIADAKRNNPDIASTVFDFIGDTLLLRTLDNFREDEREALVNWIMKFQQLTGPVMAKGVEDTVFYVYNRLVSLNEVGGHPDIFGVSLDDFHAQNQSRAEQWPHALLTTSTHDTKRAEDTRARINVLSEIPAEWRKGLNRWKRLNARKKTRVERMLAPSANDEYLLYQILVGAWPLEPMDKEGAAAFRDRIVAYMRKATKEAKVHTGWLNAVEAYDTAVEKFTTAVLSDKAFRKAFEPFARRVAFFGQFNSLSQTLLKLTSPGVPDIYQGTELWDLSLVDPDNRRPVDYERRTAMTRELAERLAESSQASQGNGHAAESTPEMVLAQETLERWQDGRVKLYLTLQTLRFRAAHELLFRDGSYQPLTARGAKAEHACAFARTQGSETAIVVAPRLVVGLTEGAETPPLGEGVWGDTQLPIPDAKSGQRYRNIFTGEVLTVAGNGLRLADVLARFPVALLTPA